ncbi:hypothetical protein [Alkalibacillus haloalkaliphilus]|uniref:hypothetical protein n=1 Tax=Alkalibacillus haloalkaliphilus TaxID=94136 RepID=UPI0002EF6121|nr:hypothetical protein [Alkalibacillus haloalkaliphilus]
MKKGSLITVIIALIILLIPGIVLAQDDGPANNEDESEDQVEDDGPMDGGYSDNDENEIDDDGPLHDHGSEDEDTSSDEEENNSSEEESSSSDSDSDNKSSNEALPVIMSRLVGKKLKRIFHLIAIVGIVHHLTIKILHQTTHLLTIRVRLTNLTLQARVQVLTKHRKIERKVTSNKLLKNKVTTKI